MPALDRALDFLLEHAPITLSEARQALWRAGLTERGWDPRSILAVAVQCGRETELEVRTVGQEFWVVTQQIEGDELSALLKLARRQAGASGSSHIDEVLAEAEHAQLTFTPKLALRALRANFQFLVDDWFWIPDLKPQRNRLRNVLRKMLSVSPQIQVSQLRDGVRRHFKHRQNRGIGTWRLTAPPQQVLLAFLAAHPEFAVADDIACSVEPLDWRAELSPGEQIFVETLLDAEGRILRREDLWGQCSAKGMSSATFNAYLGGCPVVRQVTLGVWGLRGFQPDPVVVEVVRIGTARPRTRRVDFVGWTENGPQLEMILPGEVSNCVIGIPAAIRPYICGQSFAAVFKDGSPCGTVRIAPNGSSWGYGQFLRRTGADPGDVLRVSFDLAGHKVRLELLDEGL